MKVVLFDLADTLLDGSGSLRDGAIALLDQVRAMRDADGQLLELALIGDCDKALGAENSANCIQKLRAVLDASGLSEYCPFPERVTFSSEAAERRLNERVFQRAIEKIDAALDLHAVIFVSTDADDIARARELGMNSLQFRGSSPEGDFERLADLVEPIKRLSKYMACCSKHDVPKHKMASQATESLSVDAAIASKLAGVDHSRLTESMERLTAFPTRWSFSPNIGSVTDWIHSRFQSLGYGNPNGPRFSNFQIPGQQAQQRNVLCGPASLDSGFILLCAHYDSISEIPRQSAPGADDNATGIAVLLEVARLLKDVQLTRGVCYAAFGGEEQGLFGSQACADIAAAEQWKIDLLINLDMIAFQEQGREGKVVVEYDQGNVSPVNDAAAKAFGLQMAQVAVDYTSLSIEHTDIYRSDYMPFEAIGYPCIGVYEGGENPNYHTTNDTLSTIKIAHLEEITKMVLATILEVGK